MIALHILLSNDDGIHAPGLHAAYDALTQAGHRVSVVAPAGERSASSQAISIWKPLEAKRVERDGAFFGISLDALPADCVKFALQKVLADDMPDLVVGGINPGPNIGDAVFYSGTVGVAAEAAFYDVPAIAVSIGGRASKPADFKVAADFTVELANNLKELPFGPRRFLNVNVPMGGDDDIKGVAVTRMGVCKFMDDFQLDESDGRQIWANKGTSMAMSPDAPDVDDLVMEDGYISVTPMFLDITCENDLASLGAALRKIDPRARTIVPLRHQDHAEHVEEMSPFPIGPEGAPKGGVDSGG